MHTLSWELKRLAHRYPEGSFSTQANRRYMLEMFGEQLWEAGYKKMHADELKGRHVEALLRRWREDQVAASTIKNRLSVLRWWAVKVQKKSLLANSNDHYGIPRREVVAKQSKAQELPEDKLAKVRNAHVRMSLELQRAFGLRREESMKIRPWQADHGDRLVLKGSWTKGGRPREIPIRTTEQRAVLDRAKGLAKAQPASLIPAHKTYAQQLHSYEGHCRRAGLNKMHGLRHAYAQARFADLAGFACPAAGGPQHEALSPQQREADYEARLVLSEEMGHGRVEITAAYLGR